MTAGFTLDRRSTLIGLVGVAGAGGAIAITKEQRRPAGSRQTSQALPVKIETGETGVTRVSMAQVPIGGGGFVTGIDISSDGSRFVCRTDASNAYVRDSADAFWRPLFSPSSLSAKDLGNPPDRKDKADSVGVAGIRLAPSNKDVIFATYLGYVWKSIDGGRSVEMTNLPQKRFHTNAGLQRLFNPTIDIHPSDPQIVMVGSWGEGAWYTIDGGITWNAAALPNAGKSHDDQPGLYLVLFDAIDPKRVYVFVTGVGLFKSNNGPSGTFELMNGGPTHSSNIVASPDGSVFVCEQTKQTQSGQVWRYAPGGGWTSTRPNWEASVLAVDPHNPRKIFLMEANGSPLISDDACATIESAIRPKWASQGGEIEWMHGLNTIFPAQLRFDPKKKGRLWIAQGVGVASVDIDASPPIYEDWSAGIEEICATSVLCVPGGKTFFSAWDKPFWRVDSLSSYTNDFRYPVAPGTKHTTDLVAFASSLDFAPEDPNFLVGVVAPSDKSAPGFTNDGGTTWSAFSGTPASGWGHGGCVAAASKENFILLPSNNATGVFTTNGGKSWSPIKLDGSNPTDHFSNAYYVSRKNISADKTRVGTFAVVYTTIKNDQYAEPLGGLWLTRDGGRTWEQRLTGVIGPGSNVPKDVLSQGLEARQFWSCQLEYVPGRSGELVYTPHADMPADRFYWSRDDGRSWAELHESVRNVRAFAFGKSAPGSDRPALYFWAEISGKEGLFVTFDWFASAPLLITRYPSAILPTVSCLGGDLETFGRLYVGTSCAGWVRVDIQV